MDYSFNKRGSTNNLSTNRLRASENNINESTSSNLDLSGGPKIPQRRYFGDVTLEMIDDFLNPVLNKRKDKVHKREVSFVKHGLSTRGVGLIQQDSDDEQSELGGRAQMRSLHSNRDDDKYNFGYVSTNKKAFEQELRGYQSNMEALYQAETSVSLIFYLIN